MKREKDSFFSTKITLTLYKILMKPINLNFNMGKSVNIADLKLNFPDEWVLLGNPIMDMNHLNVLEGIPIYHSKDKKEVCYIGRDKTKDYDKITLIYTGNFKHSRKITGIFNRITK